MIDRSPRPFVGGATFPRWASALLPNPVAQPLQMDRTSLSLEGNGEEQK
jgi:hypothetical protein